MVLKKTVNHWNEYSWEWISSSESTDGVIHWFALEGAFDGDSAWRVCSCEGGQYVSCRKHQGSRVAVEEKEQFYSTPLWERAESHEYPTNQVKRTLQKWWQKFRQEPHGKDLQNGTCSDVLAPRYPRSWMISCVISRGRRRACETKTRVRYSWWKQHISYFPVLCVR